MSLRKCTDIISQPRVPDVSPSTTKMAQRGIQNETTLNGLEIQFLVSNILHVDADGIVTGQGPVFEKTSLVTENLLKSIPEFQGKRELLRKSDMWSVHKTHLSDDSRYVKWIITCFFKTDDDSLKKEMPSLYRKILKKADKHVTNLAIPLLGSGRGGIDEVEACCWLIRALLDFKPVKSLKTVKIVHREKGVVDMMVAQCRSLQEQQCSDKRRRFKVGRKDKSNRTRSAEIEMGNEDLFRLRAFTNPNDSVHSTLPKAVPKLQISTDNNKTSRPLAMALTHSSNFNIPLSGPRFMTIQGLSNVNVQATKPGSMTKVQSPNDNVSFSRRGYKTGLEISNVNVQQESSASTTTSLSSNVNRRTRVSEDYIHHASEGIIRVTENNTQREITKSERTSEGLGPTDVPQPAVFHPGARPYSESSSQVHEDFNEVKTGPAHAVIPRRRIKDRFKVEGERTKPSEIENIEEDFRLQFGHVIDFFKIQSVENVDQKQQYEIKRNQILKRLSKEIFDMGEIQRTLWFHASKDLIDYVSKHGFNRNVCRNDGAYGEGVYFSTSAVPYLHMTSSLLHQGAITPPAADSQETQYVFRAKVLTGRSKLGTRGIRVLEDTEPEGLCDSTVDDLQSPSIYVVYNDTQAYPDYLIEYTIRV